MKMLTVPAEIEQLDTVLQFISGQLKGVDCPDSVLMEISIAVEEIFVNIAHYAYEKTAGEATIRCQVGGNPPQVTIEFSDSGILYNPLAKEDPDITLSAEARAVGGLGIFMVKQIMDSVSYEYRDGKNILTISKKVTG